MDPGSRIIRFCEALKTKKTEHTEKNTSARYFGTGFFNFIIYNSLREEYGLSRNCRSYRKMVKERCLFQSCFKPLMRSDNAYALTSDGQFVILDEFSVDEVSLKELSIYRKIITADAHPNVQHLKKLVSIERENIVLQTADIVEIWVHLKGGVRYISSVVSMICY